MRYSPAALLTALVACITTGDEEAESTRPVTTQTASEVPTSPAALNVWLQSRMYASWRSETKAHASAGPHGRSVLAHVNRVLDASLAAGDAEHPAGAASVKEVLTGGAVTGWLVAVKTNATSAAGDGWYWYEVTSTEPGATPASAGNGVRYCADCHQLGRDFVRSVYPLR